MSGDLFHWDELSGAEVAARLEQLEREGRPAVSDFLDIHQWLPLAGRSGLVIDGGYSAAQFRRVALGGQAELIAHYHIVPGSLPDNARTAHGARVMLGKAAGRQGLIGDVVLGSHLAVVAEPGALDSVPGIALQPARAWSPPEVPAKRISAAANRIDAVLAAAFQISRDEAQTALKYKFIFLNFEPVSKRTAAVSAGDIVIFRSKGKLSVQDLGQSKSGRCWLEAVRQPA